MRLKKVWKGSEMNETKTIVMIGILYTSIISLCISMVGILLFSAIILLDLFSRHILVTIVGLTVAVVLFLISIASLLLIKK